MQGIDRRAMASLSGGHAATDFSQGAVSSLLVFFRGDLDLSYTQASAIILVATFASSLIQPVFGVWSDRRPAIWLLPLGVLSSGIGIALACVAPNYPLLLLCVLLSGVGVAAYHPEASKYARYVSGTRRAGGMSLFSIGGNLGFALGPVAGSSFVLWLGLEGGLLLAVPAVVVGVLLVTVLPYLHRFTPEKGKPGARYEGEDQPRALALLLAVVSFRSVGHMGLFTFIPLWEVAKGNGEAHGSRLLSLFLLSGAIGTLLGGQLADRVGHRAMTRWSHVISVPLILVYVLVGGIVGDVFVVLAGGVIIATFSVTLVMSQEYLPRRVGLASGLSIGLSIGLGGVAAVALGGVADLIGIKTAVIATVSGPAIAALLTFWLPEGRAGATLEPDQPAVPVADVVEGGVRAR